MPNSIFRMKSYALTRIIAACFLLTVTSQAAQNRDRKSELAGWGVTSNPDGDCQFFISEGSLLIHVPGGPPHDLAAEINVVNAPRALQTAKGDFTLQVLVDGRFAPGSESMLKGRTAYNGAGLVAVFDEKNVVTLARAVLQRGDGKPWPYANFEIRTAGSVERFGVETDLPVPLDKPVFLRLERRGQKMLGAASTDGINWDTLEPKTIPDSWPKELQVGVVAISTSKEEFNPRFSRLQLLK
jgi:regulation of enolase protein 1 (concanavalin A-like superfamily)